MKNAAWIAQFNAEISWRHCAPVNPDRYYKGMIVDQIRQRLQNGFHPFSVRLSDGRELSIPQRDFIALHPKVLVIIGENGVSHTIDPLHILSINDPAPA